MIHFLNAALFTAAGVLLFTGLLHLLPKLGPPGRFVARGFSRAPGLDLAVALLTWIPWLIAGLMAGWIGVGGSILGNIAALGAWVMLHEWAHREAVRGPRIVKVLNKVVGRWRNHAALWVTAVTYPLFWGIRFGEIVIYPLLSVLVGLPKYRQGEWVNVSRQKFDGLVGHDLIWCLYCDWMTGLYSLGAEMLRNVESFWCPIRFYEGKKCENCRVDFPDLDNGWVRADGTMGEVARTLEEKYADGRREWFGHPARKVEITVSAPGSATAAPPR